MPSHLYGPEPISQHHRWKIDLLWHSFGRPLSERFPNLSWTSGRRTEQQQAQQDPTKRAKGVGQHLLAEALDCDADRKTLVEAYRWAHLRLPWWQLIIYFVDPMPADGKGESLHLSMLSENREVKQKALYYVNGAVYPYIGEFARIRV